MKNLFLIPLLYLLAVSGFGQVVFTNVSVGSAANDGAGDSPRTAFQKINYGFLSVSNNLATNSAAGKLNATNGTAVGLTLTGTNNVTGKLTASPFSALSVNSGAVAVGPYDSPATGSANFGANSSETSYEWIAVGQRYRVRQSGTVTKARFYNANLTGVTALYVKVWRLNSTGAFFLVGSSSDILSSVSAGTTSTATISIPNVEEGDYWGLRVEYSGGASTQNFVARTGQTGVTNYAVINATPTANGYSWTAQTATAGTVVPVELQMAPPTFVAIGDSIMAGHNAHFAFTETTATTDINSTIPYHVARALGATYQNMGIGSQTSSQIEARFADDVIAKAPRFALINGGVNDLAAATSLATIQTNYLDMMAACVASNITPVVLMVLPWTDGDSTEMGNADTLNTWLATLVPANGGVIVDARSAVGVYRDGGTSGNLWDIQARYNGDNIHFNEHGHEAIAQAVVEALNRTEFDAARIATLDVRNRLKVQGELAIERPDLGTTGTTTPTSTTIYRSNTESEAHRFTGGTRGSANGLNYYDTTSRANIVSTFSDAEGHGAFDVKNSSGTVNVRLRGQDSTNSPSYFQGPVAFGATAMSGRNENARMVSDGIPWRFETAGLDTYELHHSAVNDGFGWYNATDGFYPLLIDHDGFVKIPDGLNIGDSQDPGTNGLRVTGTAQLGNLAIGTNAMAGTEKLVISHSGIAQRIERSGSEPWEIHHGAVISGLGFYNATDGEYRLILKEDGTIEVDELNIGTLTVTNAGAGIIGKTNVTAGRLLMGNGTNALVEMIIGSGLTSSTNDGAGTHTLTSSGGSGTAGITGSGATTNNDDFTTLYTYTFPATNLTAQLGAHVLGAGPTNIYGFNVAAVVKNLDGTAAIVGTNNTYIIPAGTNITAYWDVSTDTARLRVRGTASENVNWVATNILVNVVTNGAAETTVAGSTAWDGAVAAWNLNEASGSRTDTITSMALTDNNTVTSRAGKFTTAAEFDRANTEYLSVSDNATLSVGSLETDLTISAWVWFDDVPDASFPGKTIVGKWNSGGGEREYLLTFDRDGGGVNKVRFYAAYQGSGGTEGNAAATTVPVAGQWYHILAEHDATLNELRVTVNMDTPTPTAWSNGIRDGTSSLMVGRHNGIATHYIDGAIDDVVIWKRILTSDEKAYIYNSGTGRAYGE